ncbi:MAG: 3-phosphoshikimate 1-carboxyvinyltransferase, partial [Lachnospiraceae bacterium]|nr:3-phosphoshikimate 1-carboxyvinyltransferase [Lachnospiraceae bacterium]
MRSITHTGPLKGEITIPGDKSISHRSVMFGSLAKGITHISGFLTGADCLSTIDVFRKMGVMIEQEGTDVKVHGLGLHSLKTPTQILNCGNSGTTMRLMSGILSGQSFASTLTGDASIQKRPMKRVITPLSMMGASITGREGNFAPLDISPAQLKGIHYDSPVASAQVKSAVLLAGLYANGETTVTEPVLSRNHTELMLKVFGADINS